MRVMWVLCAGLLLVGCGDAVQSAPPSQAPYNALSDASTGVCEALGHLPSMGAAERDFFNHAHAALHALAAEPDLDRDQAGRILEQMNRVEEDFALEDLAALPDDLQSLLQEAQAALRALDVTTPGCAA